MLKNRWVLISPLGYSKIGFHDLNFIMTDSSSKCGMLYITCERSGCHRNQTPKGIVENIKDPIIDV